MAESEVQEPALDGLPVPTSPPTTDRPGIQYPVAPDSISAPAPEPDAAAQPKAAAAPRNFDDVFAPQKPRSFEDVFSPNTPQASGSYRWDSPSPSIIPGAPLPPMSFNSDEWADYMKNTPIGRVMSAMGKPLSEPEIPEEAADYLRKAGVYNDYSEALQKNTDSFAQALVRPILQTVRGINENFLVPAAAAPISIISGLAESAMAGVHQLGSELQQNPILAHLHPEQFATDVSAELERAFTVGEMGTGGVPHPPEPRLPAPIADAVANGLFEGAGSDTGMRVPTPEDLEARKAAAVHLPPDVDPASGSAVLEPAGAREPVTPPDIHAIAAQIDPQVTQFRQIEARKDTFARWIQELQEPTAANIEANPPPQLQDVDTQIAAVEKKAANAGARMQETYAAQLDDLHEKRADVLNDLVQNDPGVVQVRRDYEDARARMVDMAPAVSEAYRQAEQRMPQIDEVGTIEPASEALPPVAPGHVRMYSSAGTEADGKRWATPSLEYARKQGTVDGEPDRAVSYVDVPVDHPSLVDATGSMPGDGIKPEFTNSKLSADLAEKMRPIQAADQPGFGAAIDTGTQSVLVDTSTEAGKNAAAAIQKINEDTNTLKALGENVSRETQAQGPITSPEQVQAITDDVERKLIAAGRPADEARFFGQLAAARVSARAEQMEGKIGSAKEIYDREGPQIVAAVQAAPRQKAKALAFASSKGGDITWKPGSIRALIRLFTGNADPSTIIHESGHQWLQELMRDADHPAAPESVKSDARAVREYLKADDTGPITSKAKHEKFARTAERYLMEGIAPTKALARVFEHFKGWITKVYDGLKAAGVPVKPELRTPLKDDIRGVFDRLLAKNPERTTIAPELPFETGLGDRHEAMAENATPETASRWARTIRSERGREVAEKHPELSHDLAGSGTPTGVGETPREGADGGVTAAEPVAGDAGGVQAPGTERPSGGQFKDESPRARPEGARESGLYARVGKEPRRLAEFVKSKGGISDGGDDLNGILGADRRSKGVAKKTGETIERMAESAKDAGYFPELGGRLPEPGELLAKLRDDLNGTAQYSDIDAAEVATYHDALNRNHEVDRIANDLAIDTKTMTRGEFWDKVAERLSEEDAAKEIESLDAARADERGELEKEVLHVEEHPEALEPEEVDAGRSDLGDVGPEQSGLSAGDQGQGQEASGSGGRAGRAAGGAGPEGGAAGAGIGKRAEQPESPHDAFEPVDSRLVDKAGNIRLENIDSTEDVKQAMRDAADRNNDFLAERRGVITDAQAFSLADAMGMKVSDLDSRAVGQAFNAEQIIALEKLLIESGTAVADAARAAKEAGFTEDSLAAMGEAESRQRVISDFVQGHASGVRAEAGRALHAYKAIKDLAGHAESEAIQAIMRESTGLTFNQLKQRAFAYANLDTPAKVNGAIREMNKPSLGDMFLEIFKNWLISNPITHMVYAEGNAAMAMYKATAETAAQAAAGIAREKLTGQVVERTHFREIMPQLHAMYFGQRNGWRAAYDSFRAGQTMGLPHEELDFMTKSQRKKYDAAMSKKGTTHEEAVRRAGVGAGQSTPFTNTKAVPGVLGNIVRAPGERMVAPIHSYFRTIGYLQSIAKQSAHIAIEEGRAGDDLARRMAELSLRPSEEMMTKARDEASAQTLMGGGGEFTKRMAKLVNTEYDAPLIGNVKPIAFIDPFVKVQSNIVAEGALTRGPLGLLTKDVRDNLMGRNGALAQSNAAGMIVLGSSLMVVWGGLEMEGLLNPSAPHDPHEAAMSLMVNGMPHSAKFGEMSYEVSRLGPIGWGMGLAADVSHAIRSGFKDTGTISDVASLMVMAFGHNFTAEGAMRGPSDVLKALDDPDNFGASYLKNFAATAVVPFSVGTAAIAHQIDPYSRRARTFMEAVKSRIPWVSESLFPRRDIWGAPIPNKEFEGIYVKRVAADPVNQELLKLGIFPAPVSSKILGVELTEQQYDDYAKLAGVRAKMDLDALVQRPTWAGMPGSVKHQMMAKYINGARLAAQRTIAAASMHTDNDILAMSKANRKAIMAAQDEADDVVK